MADVLKSDDLADQQFIEVVNFGYYYSIVLLLVESSRLDSLILYLVY